MELNGRKQAKAQDVFIFINDGQRSTKAGRQIVRRHAIRRAVAAKKAIGGYRKYNLGQLPLFESGSHGIQKNYSIPPFSHAGEVLLMQRPSLRGYEAARARYGFDLFSISILTSIHFSIASAQTLTSSRKRLARVLWATREASYLDYIPHLYGQSPLLQAVVDCTLARARNTISDNTALPETEVLGLFGKALAALQDAFADQKRRYDVGVLLATNIMSLCELLDFSQANRWQQHISGMINLTEARGSHRYTTELEKSLLKSSAGTIFSETLTKNKPCFLETKEWKAVLRSIGTSSSAPAERDSLMEVWVIVSALPQLFKRTRQHILQAHSPTPSEVMDLMLSCYRLRYDIISWIDRHGTLRAREMAKDKYAYCGNVGGAIAAQCMLQRLLVALQPRGAEAMKLETSTQELAGSLITFSGDGSQTLYPCIDLLLAQKRVIANTVLATKDAWMTALRTQPTIDHGDESHIDPELFRDYCERLGRSSTPV